MQEINFSPFTKPASPAIQRQKLKYSTWPRGANPLKSFEKPFFAVNKDPSEKSTVFGENDYGLFFCDDKIVTQKGMDPFVISCVKIHAKSKAKQHGEASFLIDTLEDKNIYAASCNLSSKAKDFKLMAISDALFLTDQKIASLICRTKHLLNWDQNSYFSKCCGSFMELNKSEIAKSCSTCTTTTIYPPRLSTFIVVIKKEGKILLASSSPFNSELYSPLTSCVEEGENWEDVIHREVRKVVGIKIKDLIFFPNPSLSNSDSSITGVHATYAEGKMTINKNFLEDAKWFDPNELPHHSHPNSLFMSLIKNIFQKTLKKKFKKH